MYDALNILDNYVCAIKTTQSSEITVANVRSFTKLLQSTTLQPIITTIKEQKYNDLTGFQTAVELSAQGSKAIPKQSLKKVSTRRVKK